MKVIHILDELRFSGAEIMYVAAAPIFQELGCELSVVNTRKKMGPYASYFEKAGYQVLHIIYPQFIFRKWAYFFSMIRFLKKNHYDVVHIHRDDMKWGMSLCARIVGCRSVYTLHSIFFTHIYSHWYHRWSRWSAQKILHCTFQSISDSVYEHERNYFRTESVKVYNWYNTCIFFPAKEGEKEIARRELKIDTDALVLISVGGCSQIKRHTEIIKALSYIVKKKNNTLYLHLGEGDVLQSEQDLAKQLNLENHICFCGNQSNVRKYLIAADIYVMTSQLEGISLTTIESMACKTPAVLYNVQGLREFNKESTCSALVPEDHIQLAENIIRLHENKALQEELTKNACQFVHRHFDMRKNVSEIFQLYQNKN